METKEQLVNNIKEWIKMDNEIAQLKTEIKDRNNKKKTLTENLVSVMKTNQIDCFDINGGALVYKTNKVKKPINGKTLLAALQNYYKTDVKMAEELAKHVMDSREEQIKETIKRKIDK
jgi:predicted  nucleic acid-binding Zn-ribbon protein